jgi:hypothetical protein
MLRQLRYLIRSERGSITVLTAGMLVVLMGFVGLGLDSGSLFNHKRTLQTAADDGALQGAYEIYRGHSTLVTPQARTGSAENGYESGTNDVTVDVYRPPITGYYVGDTDAVEVVVRQPSPITFMTLFGFTPPTIPARAVAWTGANSPNCIYVMEESDSASFRMENDASLTSDCGIRVNSTAGDAMRAQNTASVTATSIGITGGAVIQGASVSPTPIEDVPASPDPLGNLVPPPYGVCNHTDFTLDAGTTTLSPGVYCNGLKLEGNARAILNPGIYVINGGHFVLENTSVLDGADVMFYLTSDAYITSENTTTMRLSAQNDDPDHDCRATPDESFTYAGLSKGCYGILFFSDRANDPSQIHRLENGSDSYFEGALYFVTQTLRIENLSNAAAAYTVIVARELEMENLTNLNVGATFPGGISPLRRVTLVE